MNQRTLNMITYVEGVRAGRLGIDWYEPFKDDIENLMPEDLFTVFYTLLQKGISEEEILTFLERITNIIYNNLINRSWNIPAQDTFIGVLMQENQGLIKHLAIITDIMKQKQVVTRQDELREAVVSLMQFDDHYQKKENILFPMMEQDETKYEGLSIMWALHDEIRAGIKESIALLSQTPVDEMAVNMRVGSLFFLMRSLIIKEEMILFPVAMKLFTEKQLASMYDQMFDFTFPYIDAPKRNKAMNSDRPLQQINLDGNDKMNEQANQHTENKQHSQVATGNDYAKHTAGGDTLKTDELMVHMSTGSLSFEQVELLFNALPLDISYVDENNKLRFFTRAADRIFPRSPAAIGRDVKNCHPPKSVDVVMEIIEAFRAGKENTASFWIPLKGRFVLIQYFAIRNQAGEYKGVLEASQDITDIKALEGERRLVSWGMPKE